jgi:predicted DNA-binding protein with PD1-like motif
MSLRITGTGFEDLPVNNLSASGTVVLPSTTAIGSVSSTEIGYLDNVTSSIQTQLDTKSPSASPTFTGTVTLPSTTSIGNVSSTEIGYLDNVTSAIQTQLDEKAPIASPTFTGTVTAPTITSSTSLTSTGLTTLAETAEVLSTGTISSNTFTANFNNGAVFYITTAPSANFTINVTNLPTTDNIVTVLSFFVIQGATGYIPNALQIGGSSQTIKWSGGLTPSATNGSGRVDVFTFTFIRRSSTWEVLGTSNRNF